MTRPRSRPGTPVTIPPHRSPRISSRTKTCTRPLPPPCGVASPSHGTAGGSRECRSRSAIDAAEWSSSTIGTASCVKSSPNFPPFFPQLPSRYDPPAELARRSLRLKCGQIPFSLRGALCGRVELGSQKPRHSDRDFQPDCFADEPSKEEEKPVELTDVDILKEVKEWNSAKFAAPPKEFRQGHVTPRDLATDAITKQDQGFTIKLPSECAILTPSIYAGKLFVSGGFHSKEFYCFEAATGKPVWAMNLDDDGPTSAACEDGVIVFNTESCTVFRLEADTGRQLWSWWLGDPLTSTPTISRGVVFTSYPAGGGGCATASAPGPRTDEECREAGASLLARVDRAGIKTGKILWQCWIESDVMSGRSRSTTISM